ncbi:hypothetical protein V8C86DRAFT_2873200, partial [Haematococcus lacustris]
TCTSWVVLRCCTWPWSWSCSVQDLNHTQAPLLCSAPIYHLLPFYTFGSGLLAKACVLATKCLTYDGISTTYLCHAP